MQSQAIDYHTVILLQTDPAPVSLHPMESRSILRRPIYTRVVPPFFRNLRRLPGSTRVVAPPPFPAPVVLPLVNRDVRFRNVEEMHVHSFWNITAKVVAGQIKETRSGNTIYRAVLTDLSGDKMEAIALRQHATRFNDLKTGEVYYFRCVGFEPVWGRTPTALKIPTMYYLVLHHRTQFMLVGPNVSIPRLPSHFMNFIDVARLPNKMMTDIIGMVVYVGPIRFKETFHRSTPCRDVMLMNLQQEIIVLRVWDKHVSRHITMWIRAERERYCLAATFLEVSTVQGAMITTENSQIVFEPDRQLAYELATYRRTLGRANQKYIGGRPESSYAKG